MIIIMPFTMCGCWDSTETENLGIVTIMGIDTDSNNGIRVITQEIAGNRGSVSGGDKTPFHVYSESGATISEAIQKISVSQHQRVYFGHIKMIVLSEELVSNKGIMPVMDFFERSPKIRPTARILISERRQLDKVLTTDMEFNKDTGTIIEDSIKNKENLSHYIVNNLEEFIELLDTMGREPYTSGISIEPKRLKSEAGTSKTTGKNVFNTDNTAIFKRDKMVGWFNGNESRGIAWVKGELRQNYMNIPFEDGNLAIKILKTKTHIQPVLDNGNINININIKIESNLAESQINTDFMHKSEEIQSIQEERIKEEVVAAFEKSKSLKSDVFGFGNYINMSYPKLWSKIQNNWYSYYTHLKLNISVDSIIRNIETNYKITGG